jgi:hypothetical protein
LRKLAVESESHVCVNMRTVNLFTIDT